MHRVSICLLFSLLVTPASAAELSRGHRWIRKHPLTTGALTIIAKSVDAQRFKAALNTMLAWKQRPDLLKKGADAGLQWHLHLRPVILRKGVTDQLKSRLIGHVKKYRGCTGWLVWDEPKRPEMFEAAKTIRWLKKQFPETLVYSNAYPLGATLERYYGGKLPKSGYSYEQYIRDFATIMDPDVVMYDAYPFRQNGKTANLFRTLTVVRKVALETGKPYWTFVQSHGDPRRGYRMPSESDIRMQVFAHLTSGYTGLGYFTYEDQQGPAMVSNGTVKYRPIYYHVARLNQEVVKVGQSLRFLTSTDFRYLPGPGNKVPASMRRWAPGAGGLKSLRQLLIHGANQGPWRDLLVGTFKDDRGSRYLMLTNLWHGPAASAADRQVSVTLVVDPKVKTVGRLSRRTGKAESLAVSSGRLTITLPGGTGDLLRLGDAKFPGLE